MDIPTPRQGTSTTIWIVLLVLLLVVLVLGALANGSLNLAGTQSRADQCPNFNARAEAFRLGQEVEQQRLATPFGGNYGFAP